MKSIVDELKSLGRDKVYYTKDEIGITRYILFRNRRWRCEYLKNFSNFNVCMSMKFLLENFVNYCIVLRDAKYKPNIEVFELSKEEYDVFRYTEELIS